MYSLNKSYCLLTLYQYQIIQLHTTNARQLKKQFKMTYLIIYHCSKFKSKTSVNENQMLESLLNVCFAN